MDEDEDTRALLTSANVTIMVIGAALLFGLCFSVCWNCVRKLREDFREKEVRATESRAGAPSWVTCALCYQNVGIYEALFGQSYEPGILINRIDPGEPRT